jgi:hypothetical protein
LGRVVEEIDYWGQRRGNAGATPTRRPGI